MSNMRKQIKITKLLRKGPKPKARSIPDEECDDLYEEIKLLELELREKQNELFQIKRNKYRSKLSPPKQKSNSFVRPEEIIVNNSVAKLSKDLKLMAMLTGVEVQSYVAGDHCCVVYHLQHPSLYEVKHGLRIDMSSGRNEVTKTSLPLGFNIEAVSESFDNVMTPEHLGAVRKALVAYYDRLEQFEALRKLLHIDGQLMKKLDGSHMELTFYIVSDLELAEERKELEIVLTLDYRLYDIRPKNLALNNTNIPEETMPVIWQQCAVFKHKPLHKAFREAFIEGVGPYMLVQQFGKQEAKEPPRAPPRPARGDDTFRPEHGDEDTDDE